MNAPPPAAELLSELSRAEAALAANDSDAATAAMVAAADLCRRLQAAGVAIPPPELEILRALAERCGLALTRLGEELNAESLRGDNHRRGVGTYQETFRR